MKHAKIGRWCAGCAIVFVLGCNADATPETAQAAAPAAAPRAPAAALARVGSIEVEHPIVDLGFLTPRATVSHTFTLQNKGTSPVTVLAAKPSCTCTTTLELAGQVIPPGGSLDVPVSMKAPASTGAKQVAVQIVFKGISEVLSLQLKGEIAYAVRGTTVVGGVEVPYVDAATDPARLIGEVKLRAIDDQPFLVKSVQGRPPMVVAFDPAQDAPRREYTVRYDLTGFPSVPPYLVIETDHPAARLLDLRVRHEATRLAPALSFAEFRANGGCPKPGEAVPLEVDIKHMATLELVGVSSGDARFDAALVGQRGDAAVRTIAFTVTPKPTTSGFALFPVTFVARDPASGREVKSDMLVFTSVQP